MMRIFPQLMVMFVLAAGLTGCAEEMEETIGECEPGVSEISRIDPAPAPGC